MKKSGKTPTLDLHGFKTDDVFDAVESFLRKNENQKQVRIMPGKGTGKVKAKVEEYLRLAGYPWSPERMDNGRTNDGVMVVYME
ncbi:MAG: Smr/MutS family protein [Bdellovibrionales bacterium]|nr:Smr/MutS family protein [Bdellovibrionales bacterium]